MAGQPTSRILDSLKSLERKTGLVFTFFKASVYAMVVGFPVSKGMGVLMVDE